MAKITSSQVITHACVGAASIIVASMVSKALNTNNNTDKTTEDKASNATTEKTTSETSTTLDEEEIDVTPTVVTAEQPSTVVTPPQLHHPPHCIRLIVQRFNTASLAISKETSSSPSIGLMVYVSFTGFESFDASKKAVTKAAKTVRRPSERAKRVRS